MNRLSPVPIDRPLRILVYTLIPEGQENIPVVRSRFRTLTNRTRRALDLAQWRLRQKWRAHYSTFKDLKNTNRGDIAIRLGVRHQLNRAFEGLPVTVMEVGWGELAEGLQRHAPLDLAVIAGGGYLFADKDGRLPPRFKADVEALARSSVPAVATSIGVNQLITGGHNSAFRFAEDQHPLLCRFLSRLSLTSVRDATTQAALAAATGRTPPVIVDPAFLLPPEPGPARAPRAPLAIGLNVAFHGTDLTEKNARALPILIAGLRTLARTAPCRFTYFVHSNSERGIAAALRLSGIPCDIVDGDPAMLLAAYGKLDIHIGQMLHSAILAMSVGVPTLALAYDVKSRAFFDLFGLGHHCLDVTRFTADAFVAAVQDLIGARANIAAQIRTRRVELARESEDFYAAIRALAYQARVDAPVERSAAGNTIPLTPPIRVSTVIPAFNARPFIARALDSVFAQRLPNSEIIVVDDGSTDGTREFVATYKDRGVRLICHEKRGGAAAARNTGIAAARGEYVAFLDADDEWLPGKIERQLAVISANPGMTFITCRANMIDEHGVDRGDVYRGARPAEGPDAWRNLLANPCVATPTVLVRRQALMTVGTFNKWLPVGEDQDMWIRLSLVGEVGHIAETLVRVYNTPNSLSKAAIRDQAGYVLPMVTAYVARTRNRLSTEDVRRILGERHSKVGQWAYANRDWWFGLVTLWHAVRYGEDPVKVLSYVVRASSLVQWVKREVHAFIR